MDNPSPTPSQSPAKDKYWPDAPAVRGMVYGVQDPIHQGEKLVVMSNDTWLDYGTQAERMRRQLESAIEAGNKLKVAYDTAVKSLAELQEKHQNLRAAVKNQRLKLLTQGRPPKPRKKT